MFEGIKKVLKKNKHISSFIVQRNRKKYEEEMAKRENAIIEHGSTVISEVEETLNGSNLVFFATCGTLLGVIRENHLLKNDYDMDYAVIINSSKDWNTLEQCLDEAGYKKIRDFSYEDRITEESFVSQFGVEIDFFGHFILGDELIFYSYDKLEGVEYPKEEMWTVYILKNGKYCGTKKINTEIGTVTVPNNAEEYLAYNYNDSWRIPDPNFKANTGKGCTLIENKYGRIRRYD